MEVKKVDINIWVLPAAFGQEYYCDVGVQVDLKPSVQPTQVVAFDLTLPFQGAKGTLQDLVPVLRASASACNLVFGTNGETVINNGNFPTFDDGNGPFLLATCNMDQSKLRSTWTPKANDGRPVSAWRIEAEHLDFPSNSIYLRIRFKVDNPGRVWDWQHGVRRQAHAISDLRYNEFRTTSQQQANLPDYANSYFSVGRVNAFIIMSAKYKVGRVSPQPKYVRVLENAAWEDDYLKRRLTRRREDFIITYWPQEAVTPEKPLRSFIEVERRRPTALKSALVGSVLTIVAFLFILPPNTLASSTISSIVQQSFSLIAGVATVATALALLRLLITMSGKWSRLRDFKDSLSARMYRIK